MTLGFVEIHTSCNAAGINMSNTVQYSLCYVSNMYVLVFEHTLWLHELHFYVPQTRKPRHIIGLRWVMYSCLLHQKKYSCGYLTTPNKKWISTFMFVFPWIVYLGHKNIILWDS